MHAMWKTMFCLFALLVETIPLSVLSAQTTVSISANQTTAQLPKCLQHTDTNVYVPCTGIVPVDKNTGNPLDWNTIINGPSSTVNTPAPTSVKPVGGKDTNGNTQILSTDPDGTLNVNCVTGCSGNGGSLPVQIHQRYNSAKHFCSE